MSKKKVHILILIGAKCQSWSMPRFTLEDGQSSRSIDALQLQCHGGQGHPIS